MPIYEYKCPKCQEIKAVQRSVERREHPAACWKCWDDYHGEPTPMRLIPSVPAAVWHPTKSKA